mmetsp:Transcript_20063/g.46553  ORF Transcript_20063/g.46553 Transcript_20063/m.46553 type:complete len:190 (-) Transcript_20063:87-656(-)
MTEKSLGWSDGSVCDDALISHYARELRKDEVWALVAHRQGFRLDAKLVPPSWCHIRLTGSRTYQCQMSKKHFRAQFGASPASSCRCPTKFSPNQRHLLAITPQHRLFSSCRPTFDDLVQRVVVYLPIPSSCPIHSEPFLASSSQLTTPIASGYVPKLVQLHSSSTRDTNRHQLGVLQTSRQTTITGDWR